MRSPEGKRGGIRLIATHARTGFVAHNIYGYMVILLSVKTTIDLPDDLLISAKKAAADRRCTLRELVERGLRKELATPKRPRGSQRRVRIPWEKITVPGGLPPDIDFSNREKMLEWIENER